MKVIILIKYISIWLSYFHSSKSATSGGLVTKACLILCDPMDYSLSGPSVHGIFQTRILELVAISLSSTLGDWIWASCVTGGFFTAELAGKPHISYEVLLLLQNRFCPCRGCWVQWPYKHLPSTHTHVFSHQILGIMPLPFLLELHLLLYPHCPPGFLEWLLKIPVTSVCIPSSMFVLRASDLQMLTGEDHSVEETLIGQC